MIETEDGFAYYDENATHLRTVPGEIRWIYEKNEKDLNTHVGYFVTNDGTVTYYRLQYTPIPTIE